VNQVAALCASCELSQGYNLTGVTRRAGLAEAIAPANKTLFTKKRVQRKGSWDEKVNRRAKERWEASYRTKWAKGIHQEGTECHRWEEEGTEESIAEKKNALGPGKKNGFTKKKGDPKKKRGPKRTRL
jgi:hypothetical protein